MMKNNMKNIMKTAIKKAIRQRRNIFVRMVSFTVAVFIFMLSPAMAVLADKNTEGYSWDDPNVMITYYSPQRINSMEKYKDVKVYTSAFDGLGADLYGDGFEKDPDNRRYSVDNVYQMWVDDVFLQQDYYRADIENAPAPYGIGETEDSYYVNRESPDWRSYTRKAVIGMKDWGASFTKDDFGIPMYNPDAFLKYSFPDAYNEFMHSDFGERTKPVTMTADKITFAGYPAIDAKKTTKTVYGPDHEEIVTKGQIIVYITDYPTPAADVKDHAIMEKVNAVEGTNFEPSNKQDWIFIKKYIGETYKTFRISYQYEGSALAGKTIEIDGKLQPEPIEQGKAEELHSEAQTEFNKLLTKFNGGMTINVIHNREVVDTNYDSRVVIEDTDAPETPDSVIHKIPAIIFVGIGGGVAAVGATAGEDKKKKPKTTLALEIYKKFGDTLVKGEKQKVYAKIVEVNENGVKIYQPVMTSQISIYAGNNAVTVNQTGIEGEWNTAFVELATVDEETEDAVVSFEFSCKTGKYIQNIHFQIDIPRIVFIEQEYLIWPAGNDPKDPYKAFRGDKKAYDDNRKILFGVADMGDDYILEPASFNQSGGFSVKYEPYVLKENPEIKNLYYAVLTEIDKSEKDAGEYDTYVMAIRAVSKDGKKKAEGYFEIRRLHMGICANINAVNCYRGKTEDTRLQKIKFPVSVLTWNIKTHDLEQVAPAKIIYSIESVKCNTQKETDARNKTISALGIQIMPVESEKNVRTLVAYPGENAYATMCEIYAQEAFLDPPARLRAIISLTVFLPDGSEFETKKEVVLRSMPIRSFQEADSRFKFARADKEIRKNLERIQDLIYQRNLGDRLFPLSKMIELMLDGYSESYGYDEEQVKAVSEIWQGFNDGRILGANAKIEDPIRYTITDNLKLTIDSLLEGGAQWDKECGFFERLAYGVCTAGVSEIVMISGTIRKKMDQYIAEHEYELDKITWGTLFKIGVCHLTYEEIKGRIFGYVLGKGAGKLAKTKVGMNVVDKVKRFTESDTYKKLGSWGIGKNKYLNNQKHFDRFKENVKDFSNSLTGNRAANAAKKTASGKTKAEYEAEAAIREFRRTHKYTAQEISNEQAYYRASKEGYRKVLAYKEAHNTYNHNPIPENKALLDKASLEVLSDISAKGHLKEAKFEGARLLRQDLKKFKEDYFNGIMDTAKGRVAKRVGCTKEQIGELRATGNKKSDQFGMDLDETMIKKNAKGEYEGEIDFDIQEREIGQELHEKVTGEIGASPEKYRQTLTDYDVAVVADRSGKFSDASSPDWLIHPEKYADLKGMVSDPTIKLKNVEGDINTFIYKSKEAFNVAENYRQRAQAIEKANPNGLSEKLQLEVDDLYNRAYNSEYNAYYQFTKQHFRSTVPRNAEYISRTGNNAISDELNTTVAILKQFTDHNNGLSKIETDMILQSRGTSFEKAMIESTEVLRITNEAF